MLEASAFGTPDWNIPEAEVTRPWQWQKRWEESFQRLRQNGAPFVAPIIQEKTEDTQQHLGCFF